MEKRTPICPRRLVATLVSGALLTLRRDHRPGSSAGCPGQAAASMLLAQAATPPAGAGGSSATTPARGGATLTGSSRRKRLRAAWPRSRQERWPRRRRLAAPVKAFAEQMVADHSKANDQLKQLATTKGIMLPTKTWTAHTLATWRS